MTSSTSASAARFAAYLPRLAVIALEAGRRRWVDGDVSLVFADISGFTALSERLAAEGRIGAEKVTGIVNGALDELLAVARLEGGDVTSFGGDAVLLAFSGPDHARRAASSAWEMQVALDEYQRSASPVPLSMSVGVATGPVPAFAPGSGQRVLVLAGPTVDEVVALEGAADPGEVVVSKATMAELDPWCRGPEKEGGLVLADEPEPSDEEPADPEPPDDVSGLVDFVPPALRDELGITRLEGEHRPAVVAFVKFTGLGGVLGKGPDAAHDALTALVDVVAAAADGHGVALLAADLDADGGKLILSGGVPAATTNPEDRMLNAARTIVDADLPFAVRVGVAGGDVFAGDLGSTFRRSYTVMGDTVNLAARLAGAAVPGQVLTTPQVVGAAPTPFEVDELDPITLKGKAEPVAPVSVGPASDEAAEAEHDLPLVGREEELAALGAALEAARHGRGAAIELAGPAGMGKSRLVREARRAADVPNTMTIECEEYHASTPWHASRILLRHVLGIPQQASNEEAGEALVETLARVAPGLGPWLPLLGVAAHATVPPTPDAEALDPAFRAARTARAVGDFLAVLLDGPALIGIDNAQWIDAASRELLHTVMIRRADLPWVWVWSGDGGAPIPDTRRIEVGPLSPERALALVRVIAPGIDPDRADDVVTKAAGNPLFLAELARAGTDEALPDSIERLISRRIDGLGRRERSLLRYASVLGQQFDLDLLSEALADLVSGMDDETVWAALAEFVEVTALGRVRFRQVLVRDVAYEALPFARRAEVHGAVADTIVKRARHRAMREAAVISAHYERAGRWPETWEFALGAAERATRTWATADAARALARALAAAGHLDLPGDEVARVEEELGDALETSGRFEEAAEAYRRALDRDRPGRRSAITRKLAMLDEKAGEYEAAEARLGEALDLAASLDDRVEAMVAIAGIRNRQGDFAASAEWCRRAFEADPDETDERAIAHAHHLQVHNLLNLDEEGAAEEGTRALAIYERLNHQLGIAKVLNNLGIGAYYVGDWDEAADLYARGRVAARAAGDPVTTALLDNNTGEIRSDQGRLDEAGALFEEAAIRWGGAGFEIGTALVESNLGRLAVRRGDAPAGLERLATAVDRLMAIGAQHLVAEARARVAEGRLVAGAFEEARSVAIALLDEVGGEAWAGPVKLLAGRVVAHAQALAGDVDAARQRLRSIADAAAADGAAYEEALALEALGRLGDVSAATEAATRFSRLGATQPPTLPLPSL